MPRRNLLRRRIALFGGSFNPPHAGHREIVRRLVRRRSIDEVWVIPVWRHPFGKRLAPFARRFALCRRAFSAGSLFGKGSGAAVLKERRTAVRKVRVRDLERRLGGISYTVRLVRYLRRRYPRRRFSLVLGADAYRDRRSWKDFETIRKEVTLIVFPRGRRSPIPDVSSTAIRRRSGH